jgi:transposase
MLDKHALRELSKSDLIRLLLEQESRISKLERELLAFKNAHTPSSKQRKKNTDRDPKKPRFPGKPPGSNGGSIVLPPPDNIEDHKLEHDPETGERLGAPTGYRSVIIMDFPDKPIIVTEHRVWQYIVPSTGACIEAPVDLPAGTYGHNMKSIVVMLKALHLSCAKIAFLMQELGAPTFSHTTVKDICAQASTTLATQRAALLETLQKEPYVHADETMLRQDGKNGYAWGVFSKTIAIFDAAMSRGRKVINALLPEYHGVIVTDGYTGYEQFLYRQRCWVHLLREFKEYKDHEEIAVQYARLQLLYEQLKTLPRPTPATQQAQVKATLADIITCLKVIKAARKLVVLLENGGDEWFTALNYADVPLDNNHAERGLRTLVLLRKIIGCYRNQKGIDWINNTLSALYTWKLQEQNVFQNLKALSWN